MTKKVVFTFGRFQGINYGHKLLIDKIVSIARSLGAENRIYTSQTHDSNKNPLPYKDKISFLKALFPQANIIEDNNIRNVFDILKKLYKNNYKNVYLVVGSDRVSEFQTTLYKYNKDPKSPLFDPTKNYSFKKLDVVSRGDRDSGSFAGISGTKMREFATQGDFKSFKENTPTTNTFLAKKIYDTVRKNMGIKEERNIQEKSERLTTQSGHTFNVFVDPSQKQVENLFQQSKQDELRWIYSDRHWYFWDAYYFDHTDAAKALGVEFHPWQNHYGLIQKWVNKSPAAMDSGNSSCGVYLNGMNNIKNYRVDLMKIMNYWNPSLKEEYIQESIERLTVGDNVFNVYIDPTQRTVETIFNKSKVNALRWVYRDKHWYFWDAYFATHGVVMKEFGLSYPLSWKGVGEIHKKGSPKNVDNFQWIIGINQFTDYRKDFPKMTILESNIISEGLYDKAAFKCIFLGGGPGAGKDTILKKIIGNYGLVEINSDHAFEMLMKKENIPMIMDKPSVERDLVRGRAKHITMDRYRLALAGRLGIIINGTGDDINEIQEMKKLLYDLGYDCMMVFVSSTNEVSAFRNIARGAAGGRAVPETIRGSKWRGAENNKNHYRHIFGSAFIEFDNSTDINDPILQTNILSGYRKIMNFINTKVTNPYARAWRDREKANRGIMEHINSDELMEKRVSFKVFQKQNRKSI